MSESIKMANLKKFIMLHDKLNDVLNRWDTRAAKVANLSLTKEEIFCLVNAIEKACE